MYNSCDSTRRLLPRCRSVYALGLLQDVFFKRTRLYHHATVRPWSKTTRLSRDVEDSILSRSSARPQIYRQATIRYISGCSTGLLNPIHKEAHGAHGSYQEGRDRIDCGILGENSTSPEPSADRSRYELQASHVGAAHRSALHLDHQGHVNELIGASSDKEVNNLERETAVNLPADQGQPRAGISRSDRGCGNPLEILPGELPPKISASRRKHDLSHRAVRRSEEDVNTHDRVSLPSVPSSDFRSNAGMRSVVSQYMRHIEPLLVKRAEDGYNDSTLDHWLSQVFSDDVIHYLHQRGYDVQDVVVCGWILSDRSEVSIKRYTIMARAYRRKGKRMLPQFIPLQILRSPVIHRDSLTLLLDEIQSASEDGEVWNSDSAAILLIRLLRHARMTNVFCYERIANLVPQILPLETKGSVHDSVQRLTHFYNRFLSLLALPVARNPFLSIDIQQRAQLLIARSMMGSHTRLPLNREGYRALARVQLLHQKTVEEQRWSSVKAPSWPPWRRDELGIDAKIEYPGEQSRVSKVIKRLLEAGYGPGSMEFEAQILSGWDTDKSPTVQVRRLTSRRPLAWIKSILQKKPDQLPEVDHHVWAARVAATRSVREAWLCFYSYMQATANQPRQLRVYHEMFHKLFARVQDTDQRIRPSPGDGKEVFPDPISARDLVYVPKEPPSIDELYAQMLQDGIKPAGRLLANLIDSARSLKQGLDTIRDSALGDVKKDVLLHSEKYPGYAIRSFFTTLPDYLLASYIGLTTKGLMSNQVQLFWPGSKSTEERGILPVGPVKPLLYGMTLLQIWKPAYMPVYHAALEGICIQAKARHSETGITMSRDHSYLELWKSAKHILFLIEEQSVEIDLTIYRKLLVLIRNVMVRAPAQFRGDQFQDTTSVVKAAFVKSIHGSTHGTKFQLPRGTLLPARQPYWKDVESFILILGFDQEFAAVNQVLNWMSREEEHLEFVDGGSYKMQRILCAARVALEGTWALGKTGCASEELIRQARDSVKQWGWPEDVDVDEFLETHRVWVRGMKAAVKVPLE